MANGKNGGIKTKTKSVLFSEMRNKLGNQVVGTGWKGRMVLRAHVTPANPKTCSQRANRDMQDKVLKLYQANVGNDATRKAQWDEDALPRSISGYNLFMMLGRSSRISCDTTGTTGVNIDVTYTVTKDISTSGIYVLYYDPGTEFDEVVAIGSMLPGDDNVITYNPSVVSEHIFYIVDDRSKTIPPVLADQGALVNSWSMDETVDCEADLATCEVSAP